MATVKEQFEESIRCLDALDHGFALYLKVLKELEAEQAQVEQAKEEVHNNNEKHIKHWFNMGRGI